MFTQRLAAFSPSAEVWGVITRREYEKYSGPLKVGVEGNNEELFFFYFFLKKVLFKWQVCSWLPVTRARASVPYPVLHRMIHIYTETLDVPIIPVSQMDRRSQDCSIISPGSHILLTLKPG